jgi:hypothetical protein
MIMILKSSLMYILLPQLMILLVTYYFLAGLSCMVVIVWYMWLDLQLPVQSVHITTKSCEF